MDAFVQHLKMHASAALYYHPNFTMVVYPMNDEAWKLFPSNKRIESTAKLRFCIHKPTARVSSPTGPIASFKKRSSSEAPIITLFREVLGITPEGLFTWRDGKTEPEPIKRNVFLMIPPRYKDEVALLHKFLAACEAKVSTMGSWAKFSKLYKSTSGVVLVSPDAIQEIQIRQ